MSKIEKKLAEIGYHLPQPFKFPNPNRTGCVQVGSILFLQPEPPPPVVEERGVKIHEAPPGSVRFGLLQSLEQAERSGVHRWGISLIAPDSAP